MNLGGLSLGLVQRIHIETWLLGRVDNDSLTPSDGSSSVRYLRSYV